ncbi:MAG: sel1 repeat family protein [Labilithrix sp.]|nr:sel1 repeat family protein [Labilithrix sp.]
MKLLDLTLSSTLLATLALGLGGCGGSHEPPPVKAPSQTSQAPASAPSTASPAAEPDDNVHCGSDAEQCSTKGALALLSSNAKKEGRAMLEKACSLGSNTGCTNLGRALFNGAGGDTDRPRALALWQKACASGAGGACNALGGATADDDPAAGRKAFERGCALDEKESCANLAVMAAKGEGGPRDERTAATSSAQACKKKAPLGCLVFGVLARDGLGTQKDLKAAKAAFRVACEGGRSEGCDEERRLDASDASTGADADGSGKKSTMTAGGMTVDGMKLKDMSCDLSKGGPFGMLGVAGGLRARKAQLDACSKRETETRIVLRSAGGRFTAVEAKGASTTVGRCVERALVNQRSTFDGTCSVTVVHGRE